MKLTSSVLVTLLVLCGSCAATPHLSTHPHVIIDESFNPTELAAALTATNSWSTVVSGIDLTTDVSTDTHDSIIARLHAGSDHDTIFYVASHGAQLTEDCPSSDGVPETYDAWTSHDGNGNGVVCVNVMDQRHYGDRTQGIDYSTFIMTHETGHALYLVHTPDTTQVMFPETKRLGPTSPQPGDVAALMEAWKSELQ